MSYSTILDTASIVRIGRHSRLLLRFCAFSIQLIKIFQMLLVGTPWDRHSFSAHLLAEAFSSQTNRTSFVKSRSYSRCLWLFCFASRRDWRFEQASWSVALHVASFLIEIKFRRWVGLKRLKSDELRTKNPRGFTCRQSGGFHFHLRE